MGFWSFVALAVVCGCLLEGYRIYAKSRFVSGGDRIAELEERLAAVEESGNLEDRVRALEAIVTDPRSQLDREIAGLKE